MAFLVVDSSMSRSTSDLNSINVDVESNNSSPRTIKVSAYCSNCNDDVLFIINIV